LENLPARMSAQSLILLGFDRGGCSRVFQVLKRSLPSKGSVDLENRRVLDFEIRISGKYFGFCSCYPVANRWQKRNE